MMTKQHTALDRLIRLSAALVLVCLAGLSGLSPVRVAASALGEGAPMQVALSSVEILRDGDTLRAKWSAEEQVGVVGYDVYAAAEPGGTLMRVTQETVPADASADYYYQIDVPTLAIGAEFYIRALGEDGGYTDIGPTQAIYSGPIVEPVAPVPPTPEPPKNMAAGPDKSAPRPTRPLEETVGAEAQAPVVRGPITQVEAPVELAPVVARSMGAGLTGSTAR